MALFGAQLVITMVMASFLQKLTPHFSLARWLITRRLTRYLHPTNEELRHLSGHPATGKGKNNRNYKERNKANTGGNSERKDDSFTVPRNIEIQLEATPVETADVVQLRFYTDYQWLVDFAACTMVVYALTEVYLFLFPVRDEANLSVMWCLLVIGLSLKVLFSMTALYFYGDESTGERSMCITCGFFFLLVAMVVLIIDEKTLEFGLDRAYKSFSESVAAFLQTQGPGNPTPASLMGFKFVLATWSVFIGAFLTFPGLRFAKMHCDSLKYCADSPLLRFLLNLSFVSPFLLALLWVKPISKDYFTVKKWGAKQAPLMTDDVFDMTRFIAVMVVVALRFVLMPRYLQAYLNMAHDRINEMKKEAGRINSLELQRMVARVFYYLCVVALQYIAPVLLCLCLTLLLKSLGDYSWSVLYTDTCSVTPPSSPALDSAASLLSPGQEVTDTLSSIKRIFSPVLYRGVLTYMTWWVCLVWFTNSAIGLVYYSYFASQ